MKSIINKNLILSKKNFSSKKELFKSIVDTVSKNNRTNNKEKLFKDISDREKLASTSFENGLMIPHARSKYINEITLVVVPFNDVNFNSLDGKPTNFAVAILVPEEAKDEHLSILSKLSNLFSSKDKLTRFKNLNKDNKIKILLESIKINNNIKNNNEENYDIVGITSCPAGIAHTYMARDKLIEASLKKGLKIKIETQGSITENKLSEKEINNAGVVLIAADVKVDQSRFIGKPMHVVTTQDAIRNGTNVIESAWSKKNKKLKEKTTEKKVLKKTAKNGWKKFGTEIRSALMTSVGYMLPIIVAGALLFAIPTAIAGSTGYRDSSGVYHNGDLPQFLQAMQTFGLTGFATLAIPIIGMYIAYAIGGKPAMAAGLIGTFFANDGEKLFKFSYLKADGQPLGAGFFGAIIIGLFAGYIVKYMRWIKWHRHIKPATGIIIIPLISTFITFIFVVYVIGGPIAWIMSRIYDWLGTLKGESKWVVFGIGALFGGMIAFDFGGPIGKIAWFVGNGIFVDTVKLGDPNLMPITSVAAAISLAPIGVFIATKIFRKKFTKEEHQAGSVALPLGLVGISEGALPFAFKDPAKLIFANVISGILTGGLVAVIGMVQWGGLGSPIGGWAGYTQNSWYGFLWCFVIVLGCFVTGIIFGLLKKPSKESMEYYKEFKDNKVKVWNKRGLTTTRKDFLKRLIFQFKNGSKNILKKSKIIFNPRNWFEKPGDW